MGYIQHDMVVVTLNKYVYDARYMEGRVAMLAPPDIEAFRAGLPPEWQALLIGPVRPPPTATSTGSSCPMGRRKAGIPATTVTATAMRSSSCSTASGTTTTARLTTWRSSAMAETSRNTPRSFSRTRRTRTLVSATCSTPSGEEDRGAGRCSHPGCAREHRAQLRQAWLAG